MKNTEKLEIEISFNVGKADVNISTMIRKNKNASYSFLKNFAEPSVIPAGFASDLLFTKSGKLKIEEYGKTINRNILQRWKSGCQYQYNDYKK